MITPLVFVTGNANKLREVKAILAAGNGELEITNEDVDRKFWASENTLMASKELCSESGLIYEL